MAATAGRPLGGAPEHGDVLRQARTAEARDEGAGVAHQHGLLLARARIPGARAAARARGGNNRSMSRAVGRSAGGSRRLPPSHDLRRILPHRCGGDDGGPNATRPCHVGRRHVLVLSRALHLGPLLRAGRCCRTTQIAPKRCLRRHFQGRLPDTPLRACRNAATWHRQQRGSPTAALHSHTGRSTPHASASGNRKVRRSPPHLHKLPPVPAK